jgi:hypothetical protein
MVQGKKLPRSVQLSLGDNLRDFYRNYVNRLPLHLVNLVRRVGQARANVRRDRPPPQFEELRNVDRDVFDPPTLRILMEAFDKAWNDLQSLKRNPVSPEKLAFTLMAMVKEGERRPSHLATKAVLKLIGSA